MTERSTGLMGAVLILKIQEMISDINREIKAVRSIEPASLVICVTLDKLVIFIKPCF